MSLKRRADILLVCLESKETNVSTSDRSTSRLGNFCDRHS